MNIEQLLAALRAGGTLTADQLRFVVGELTVRAEAMPGRIVEGMAAEEAGRIEEEHRAALAEITRVNAEIARLAAAAPPALAEEVPAEVQRALVSERARVATVRRIGREFQRSAEFIERHIDGGTGEVEFRGAILEDMRQATERHRIFPQAEIGQDETESRRAGMAQAIAWRLARANGERAEPSAIARPWAERELSEIAAEASGFRGALRTPRQVAEMFERAMHTTSDFPGIFTNALNVRLLARYAVAAPTYRRWAALYTAPDFRSLNVIRAGDFPALQLVNEAGEIKSGSFGESKELFKVNAYGIMLRISRQMIVNDQLLAIEQVLGSAGVRVADWENGMAYDLLLSGGGVGPALLTDTVAVFNSAHGNLAGTAAAISVTSVGIGRASMMKQETLDGIKANFTPVTLLTGADKLTEAEQLLTAITPAQPTNAVPEAMRRLVPVGDANITGNAWYLFADPATAPCFVYGYIDGFTGPRLSSEEGFDTQGMKVKLEHDFGVAAIDYRGGFRNAGA